MNIFLLTFLAGCWLFTHGSCRYFRLGRSRGGNLGAPGACSRDHLPPALWFDQDLDHFSRTNLQTWKQRYYVNETFYDREATAPVFLMIGGEGSADPKWMVKGAWIDYAKDYKALCLMLEHRFYGKSQPTSDMSVKNLAYLTSEQALADLANFITHMNDNLPKGTKWIVFGGSYPGSLAAWMRLKYPHLVHGAVSSSGPLIAKVDFDGYFKVVVEALKEKTGSDDCVNHVQKAHKQIVNLFATNQSKVVESNFRVCKPFSGASKDDMKNFYNSIADDFAGVVQYNEDNRMSQESNNITINTICDMLTDPGLGKEYERLAKFNAIILDASNQTCLDYSYKNMIMNLRNSTWSESGGRQWMYQTCTEFGFYQTSSGEEPIFGNDFPVDFFIHQCEDVFGKKFNKKYVYAAARWTNTNYGALNLTVTNVIFVHGSIDPWHTLGITETHADDDDNGVGVIYIKGTAHCANMYPSRDSDAVELRAARAQVAHYIDRWLSKTPNTGPLK